MGGLLSARREWPRIPQNHGPHPHHDSREHSLSHRHRACGVNFWRMKHVKGLAARPFGSLSHSWKNPRKKPDRIGRVRWCLGRRPADYINWPRTRQSLVLDLWWGPVDLEARSCGLVRRRPSSPIPPGRGPSRSRSVCDRPHPNLAGDGRPRRGLDPGLPASLRSRPPWPKRGSTPPIAPEAVAPRRRRRRKRPQL